MPKNILKFEPLADKSFWMWWPIYGTEEQFKLNHRDGISKIKSIGNERGQTTQFLHLDYKEMQKRQPTD